MHVCVKIQLKNKLMNQPVTFIGNCALWAEGKGEEVQYCTVLYCTGLDWTGPARIIRV